MTRYVLRPCWVMGLTCLFTFCLCPWLPVAWLPIVVVVGCVVCGISLGLPFLRHIHALPLIAATVSVALLVFLATWVRWIAPLQACVGQSVTLSVRVTQTGEAAVLTVEDGALASGTKLVWYAPDPEVSLLENDRFTTSFVLEEYADGTRFAQLQRRADGIWLHVTRLDIDELQRTLLQSDSSRKSVFARVREILVSVPLQKLHGDIGAVIAGICFGADEQLSAEATDAFRACGVSHLFAVSGLHMAVLLQALQWLLRRARMPRVGRLIACGAFLLLFMLVVGFSPSVVRAGTVCVIVLLGDVWKRQADTRNSLGIALLILLLSDPFAAYDVGLLLSFSATYGLLCCARPIQAVLLRGTLPIAWEKVRKPLVAAVAVTIAATATTLPVMAIYFGRVSLISVITNVLTTLPAEVALITGLLSSVLSAVGLTVLAEPFMWVAGLAGRYLLWVCEKFSTFFLATVAIDTAFLLLWIIGCYLIWILGGRVLGTHGKVALVAVCVIIVCTGALCYRGVRYDALHVTCASDEDIAAMVTHRGNTVVILAPSHAQTLYRLRDALRDNGVAHVDVLCLIGGKEPVVSYVPSVLSEFVSSHTSVVYDSLPWKSPLVGRSLDGCAVTWGDALTIRPCGDHMDMVWGDYRLSFGKTEPSNITCNVDVVLGTGETPLLVCTDEGTLALPSRCGTVVCRCGQWFVRENTR